MAETGDWVQIVYPATGATGEVHRLSLPQHYAAGWRLLTDDEAPQPEPELEPEPMTRAQAAKAAKQAASAEPEEN
jgi:hypothetical protein